MPQTVMNILVENTIVFCALFLGVGLIKILFKKHISAVLQYALWALVIVKLLVPVSFAANWSPANLVRNIRFDMPPAAVSEAPLPVTGSDAGLRNTQPQVYYTNTSPDGDTGIAGKTAPIPANDAMTVKFDWPAFGMALWLTGAAAIAARLVFKAFRLERKVKRRQSETPEWMREVFNECREELRIKKRIGICVQGILPVPAITGLIMPMLIVPERMAAEQNKEQMRHVCMHELAHYKRRDLWVLWLLNLVNAVYWFNPLVWLCTRLIHRDMETACDHTVVRLLGTGCRKEYILTILHFSGRNQDLTVQAAMSLNDGCTRMQKRIQGMYMKSRTKAPARVAVLLLSCMMALTAFTTACQPTPEIPPVVNKADGKLQQKIEQSAAPVKKYDAPQTYRNKLKSKEGKTDIVIDAKVAVPDIAQFPAVKVSPLPVSTEFIQKAITVLMDGVPVYEPRNGLTKTDIDNELLKTKAFISDKKKMLEYYSGDQQTVDEVTEMFTQRIKIYQEMREKAPDTYQKIPGKVAFKTALDYENPVWLQEEEAMSKTDKEKEDFSKYHQELKDTQQLILDADLKNGQYARIEALNSNKSGYTNSNFHFVKSFVLNPGSFGPEPYRQEDMQSFPAMTITQDEALAKAKETLESLGIKNMQLCASRLAREQLAQEEEQAIIEAAGKDNSVLDAKLRAAQEAKKPLYYSFSFRRSYYGVPSIPDAVGAPLEAAYAPKTEEECIDMFVDDTGVTQFNWRGPAQETSLTNANVPLMPFKDVMKKAEQQLALTYTLAKLTNLPQDDPEYEKIFGGLEKAMLKIDKIQLGMQRIAVANEPNGYMMVPAWRFTGASALQMKGDKQTMEETISKQFNSQIAADDANAMSYLVINALDGSVIKTNIYQ